MDKTGRKFSREFKIEAVKLVTKRGVAVAQTNAKVSDIAFALGYESSAQFSREYTPKFGVPPRQDRVLQVAD